MRCPKCGYNSFDHLDSCKKCGKDLLEYKQKFGIQSVLFPGEMKPPAEAADEADSTVVDAAVAAATAATAGAAAVATAAVVADADTETSEADDFGFDFMGESDEEEDLSFDELFEEAPAGEDVEEPLPGPKAADEAEEVGEFSFDATVEEDEPIVTAASETLPNDSDLESDFGFDLEEPEEIAEAQGAADDLAADDFELPPVDKDEFDFATDEIDFAETDETEEAGEDPKSPFDLPEPPQAEEAPEFSAQLSVDSAVAAAEDQDDLPLIEPAPQFPEALENADAAEPFLAEPASEASFAAEVPEVEDFPQSVPAGSCVTAAAAPMAATGAAEDQPPVEYAPAPLDPFADDEELLPTEVDEGLIEVEEVEPALHFPAAEEDRAATAAIAEVQSTIDATDDVSVEKLVPSSADLFAEDEDLLASEVDLPQPADAAAGFVAGPAVAAFEAESSAFEQQVLAGGAVAATAGATNREVSVAGPDDAVEASPETTPSLPSLARRVMAFLCDLLLLSAVAASFIIAAERALSGGGERLLPSLATLIDLSVPYFLVLFSLAFGYFTLFHFLVGQTPGKMLAGLRVETLDGEPLLFSQAFLRSVGGLLQLLPVGLGYLAVLFSAEQRGWNDRLAGTRMISLKELPEELTAELG